jgi:uncharacterized membrane protein
MQILRHKYQTQNVGTVERGASIMTGTLLVKQGLRRSGWIGTGAALLGIAFLRRGITGFCYTYQALGVSSKGAPEGRNASVPSGTGVRVDQAITINRPRAEVYRFWRDLPNIAQIMQHVDSIRILSPERSHWIVKGPGGKPMEWDAEIINEVEGELIAWRSLEGAEVPNAGSVHFKDAAGGRGTEIRVELQYVPPGGVVGASVAMLFGEAPSQQIAKDLKDLKAQMEAGFLPQTAGQPVGSKTCEIDKKQPSDIVTKASEGSFPASDAPAYTH